MRAPGFWWRDAGRPGIAPRLLAPLGALYALATARRVARGPTAPAGGPAAISVGNLNVGGTGKTPTVIALLSHLAARGHVPHVVSRGYGGRLPGPLRVDERRHTAADVGDEPLLLAAFAPTWVARDRAAGAAAAGRAGATVVVLDDAHQNPGLFKDFAIVTVDAARGFGNGRCIPAGPLREPVAPGLARADLLLVIGDDDAAAAFLSRDSGRLARPGGLAIARGRLAPLATGMDWAGLRVLAFAGIAHPGRFFDSLAALGADIVGRVALDDHQPFAEALLGRLERQAQMLGAQMVTTEKDAARLPAGFRSRVLTLPVRLAVTGWGGLDAALDRRASG